MGVPPPNEPPGGGWTLALARRLAKWHREKKLKLIERKDNYQIATEAEKSVSFKLYKKYIREPKVLGWLSTGLTLRAMEPDEVRRADVKFIRDNLASTEGGGALHVAELAQSGALDVILALVGSGRVHIPPTQTIDDVLSRIDQYAVFIKESDDLRRATLDADVRALGSAPFVFIVLGRWTAREKAAKVFRGIAPAMAERGYTLTEMIDERQAVGIFFRT
jgi:hypothetical protein